MEKVKVEGIEQAIKDFNEWGHAAALYWNRAKGYVETEVFPNDVAASETAFAEECEVLFRKRDVDGTNANIGAKRAANIQKYIDEFTAMVVDGWQPFQAAYHLEAKYLL